MPCCAVELWVHSTLQWHFQCTSKIYLSSCLNSETQNAFDFLIRKPNTSRKKNMHDPWVCTDLHACRRQKELCLISSPIFSSLEHKLALIIRKRERKNQANFKCWGEIRATEKKWQINVRQRVYEWQWHTMFDRVCLRTLKPITKWLSIDVVVIYRSEIFC